MYLLLPFSYIHVYPLHSIVCPMKGQPTVPKQAAPHPPNRQPNKDFGCRSKC